MTQEIDWRNATAQQKKQLYYALRAAAELTLRKMDDLFGEIYMGQPKTPNDLSNYRDGKTNATRCILIYDWLCEHHWDLCVRVEPEIFVYTPQRHWQALVNAHAKDEGLRLVPYQPRKPLDVVERSIKPGEELPTLQCGQDFTFEVNSPIRGNVLILQNHRQEWHMLPIGRTESQMQAQLGIGPNELPLDKAGAVTPINEPDSPGQHVFVALITSEPDLPKDLRTLAKRGIQDGDLLLRSVVRFVV